MKRSLASFKGAAVLLVIAFVVSILLFNSTKSIHFGNGNKTKRDNKKLDEKSLNILLDLGIPLHEIPDLTCDQIRTLDIDRSTRLPSHIKIKWISDKMYRCNELG